MQDRFLFRGKVIWDANGHKKDSWVTGFYSEELSSVGVNGEYLAVDKRVKLPMIHSLAGGTVFVYPETVGQCTGLKDKNGTLFYEGDVVYRKADSYNIGKNEPVGSYDCFGEVVFIEPKDVVGGCVVKAYDRYGNDTDFLLFSGRLGWEVIGNKYENPDKLSEISAGRKKRKSLTTYEVESGK